MKWYRKAADGGHAAAQNNLGVMYFNGDGGVKHDLVDAYVWVTIGALNGDLHAIKTKKIYTNFLDPEQLDQAAMIVGEMVKKNPKLIKKKD